LIAMDGTNPTPHGRSRAARPETEAQRQQRLARETDLADPAGAERRRRLTLEGLADVDAGRLIDDEAMRAWADSLGTDHELAPPQPD
jgi:predicted transcriptional regulator